MRWLRSCPVLSAAALVVSLSACPVPFGYYASGNKLLGKVETTETASTAPVATPTFLAAPLGGGVAVTVDGNPTEERDQQISIGCATEGALIYYTCSVGSNQPGDPPDPNPYEKTTLAYKPGEPILVAGNNTVARIKAIAFKALKAPSSIATLDLTVSYTTASSPSFNARGGIYNDAFTLKISESTPGATVWYTTDGTQPQPGGGGSTLSGVAPVSLEIVQSTQVRAVATAPNFTDSAEAGAVYTLEALPPNFSVAAGFFDAEFDTTVSAPTDGSTILYTVDGTNPDPDSKIGIEAGSSVFLHIPATTIVKAIAIKPGWSNSAIATAEYGFVPAAPSTLRVAAGITEAVAYWSDSVTAGSYNLYYRAGSSVTTTNGTKVSGAISPRTVSGLIGGTQYAFIVTAVNSYGEGPPSDVITSTPAAHRCIVDIQLYDLSSAYSGPNPTPDGYHVILQDLNEGAGGNFIYVLFKYGGDTDTNPAPITGIHVVDTTLGDAPLPGDIAPVGFCDLNHLAGGDYIYLYFSRGGPNPIRGIATKDTDDNRYFYSLPSGVVLNDNGGRSYAWVDGRDLNCGAGGDFIYIGSTTDLVD